MEKNNYFQDARGKINKIANDAQIKVHQLLLPEDQQGLKRLLLLDVQNQRSISLTLLETLQQVGKAVESEQ